jgi:hypothetical protein
MLGERINRCYLQYTGTERRVNDERHLNHVEGVLPEGAMVVIDSQMLGRIEKIVDFKTTETTITSGGMTSPILISASFSLSKSSELIMP